MKIALLSLFLMFYAGYTTNAQTWIKDKDATALSDSTEWAGIMSLYPNPAKTYVNLHVEWQSEKTFKVALFNTEQALLKEWSVTRKVYAYSIDVSQLPTGKYSVVVTTTEGARLKSDFEVRR